MHGFDNVVCVWWGVVGGACAWWCVWYVYLGLCVRGGLCGCVCGGGGRACCVCARWFVWLRVCTVVCVVVCVRGGLCGCVCARCVCARVVCARCGVCLLVDKGGGKPIMRDGLTAVLNKRGTCVLQRKMRNDVSGQTLKAER